jgi:probable phosphoglycerate mutase
MPRELALLTLIRHGETHANLEGVWHGSTDGPLTERGAAQAARVAAFAGERLRDAVALYSSPLRRARDTAQAIAQVLELAVSLHPGLAEFHLGSWEGKTYRDLMQQHRLWEHMKSDPDFAPHGGESPRGVTERITGALREIAEGHPGQRVIVVTHGGALSLGLAHLLEGTYASWGRVMDNCAVSELALHPAPALLSFNQRAHLEGL